MLRIGNARTIADIESIIGAPESANDTGPRLIHGVECTRNRYRLGGRSSSLEFEVIHLRYKQRSRKAWHAVIVGELRHSNDPTTQLRGRKSLRVVKGDAMDILSWMRARIVGTADKTVSRSIIG